MSHPQSVLLVANRTANTARLRERAAAGSTRFHLVMPAVPNSLVPVSHVEAVSVSAQDLEMAAS